MGLTGASTVPTDTFKALAHPLRVRLLMALHGRVASPRMLADELDEDLPTVSYHMRTLARLDAIELVETVPRRGALEHMYRQTTRSLFDDDQWAELPDTVRTAIANSVFERIWRDTVASLRSGVFERRIERHLSWTHLRLDPEGWGEMAELLQGAHEQALAIQERSTNRLAAESEGEAIETNLAMLHYERAPAERDGSS